MDLHIRSHPRRRLPDWPAAVVAGLAAGAILMVLELFWATLTGDGKPWAASHMVAAIVMGQGTLKSAEFDLTVVAVALAAHYVLGIVFGLILASIIAPFREESNTRMVTLAGLVFGAVLYLFNFHAMTHFFPWFVEWRGTATLITHLVFGVAAALLYWKLDRH